jgi:hypothetical protein
VPEETEALRSLCPPLCKRMNFEKQTSEYRIFLLEHKADAATLQGSVQMGPGG